MINAECEEKTFDPKSQTIDHTHRLYSIDVWIYLKIIHVFCVLADSLCSFLGRGSDS